jgi:hypothetical protein
MSIHNLTNCKTIDELKIRGKKIGYIKINTEIGQLSYSIKEYDGGLLFYNLRYHPENIKRHQIIFYNVVPKFMTMYANVIREHNENLIEEYFDKKIDEFNIKISNYGGW